MNCIKCGHVAAISEFGNPGWLIKHGYVICPSCNATDQITKSTMTCRNCGQDASNGIQNPLGAGNFCSKLCCEKYLSVAMAKDITTHDPVNHPKHYTSHPSGVECIQITRHMTFNIGNAIKYLWRCGDKDNQIQDLEKAVWYIKDEIQRLQGKNK